MRMLSIAQSCLVNGLFQEGLRKAIHIGLPDLMMNLGNLYGVVRFIAEVPSLCIAYS